MLVVVKPRDSLIPCRIPLSSVLARKEHHGQRALAVIGKDTKPVLVLVPADLGLALSIVVGIEKANSRCDGIHRCPSKPIPEIRNGVRE
jgi:hypothetical protein